MKSDLPGYNHYFKLGGKDIWSFINETAAAQEIESGSKIVNLGQGFFSYSPPEFAIKAAKDAFDVPMFNQYAPARGKPHLLKTLADTFSSRLCKKLSTDEIQVTTGANEGMLSVFVGLLEQGDEVIVFQPFFDQYIPNIEIAGGKVVYVKLFPPADFGERTVTGDEWTIDWEGLENAITSKTKMIVINSPYNPIGKVFNNDELKRIGDLAVEHNFYILSDEVYENLYFEPKLTRMSLINPLIARRTITVGSAGKTFAATGWRIGWIIADKEIIPPITAAHTRICFSTPAPLQEAVASAFDIANTNGYFGKMRADYIHKYEIFDSIFDELKLPYTVAAGGYYLLVNFKKVKIPENFEYPESIKDQKRDFKLAYWFIKEFGVVAIPPSVFYLPEDGHIIEDCLRFAICKTDDVLEEAVKRLKPLKKYIVN